MKYRCIVFSCPWQAGGRGPAIWGCAVGSVPGALGTGVGVGTRGFGDAHWGRYLGCTGGCPSRRASPRASPAQGTTGRKNCFFSFPPPPSLLRREVQPLTRFSVSQPRPLMLLPAPMIMRKVELAPLLRCDGCLDNAPIMAAIAAAR